LITARWWIRCKRACCSTPSGRRADPEPRLVAFFALMYFSALRPEEAANVRWANLALPETGWGMVYLDRATPHAGSEWTDDGRARDERQLKHRGAGEGRAVPMPPELTALLRRNLAEFRTAPEGRLLTGQRAEEPPKITYLRASRAARLLTFTLDVSAKTWSQDHVCRCVIFSR